ncbi:MAG TPA: tripartite tricarboxylate transporter substrate binding protein, partial [Burkholderiales bacterium]|nr:tripartite tricarboxylate transporter substrate binding protein [Burkholderiales bacterium]
MRLLGPFVVVLACAIGAPAQAQNFPERNITVIVPFPPGGASDISARLVVQKMATRVGQTVIVDNRGGANGAIG